MPINYRKSSYNHELPNIVTGMEDHIDSRSASVLRQPIRNLVTTIQIIDEKKGTIVDTITGKVVSGTISCDGTSLNRRTGKLTLAVDESLMPSPNSVMWFGKVFKVYQGVIDMSRQPYEPVNFLLGTFWIDDHSIDISSDSRTISIDLSDKMTRWDGVGIEHKQTYKADQKIPVNEALKHLVENAGETVFGHIEESRDEEVIPYDYEKEPGTQLMDIMEDFRDMYMTYICGYDTTGAFQIKRMDFQKAEDVPESKWVFDSTQTDRADLTLSYSQSYNIKDLRNRIMVVGETNTTTGFTPMGTVQLQDPTNPYSVICIGTRTKVITDSTCVNDMQCITKAEYELYKASNLQETVTISTAPIYFLKPNDVITVVNPVTKESGLYEIDKINVDLDVEGTMDIDAHKLYFVKPSYGEWGTPTVEAIKQGINNRGWLSLAEKRIQDCYTIMGDGDNTLFIQFMYDEDGGMQEATNAYDTTRNQLLQIDLADIGEKLDKNSPSGALSGRSKGDYLDRVLGHEMFHAVCNDYYGYSKLVNWPKWWKEGFAELLHGGKERYRSIMGNDSEAQVKKRLISLAEESLRGGNHNSDSSESYVAYYLTACAIYFLLGKDGLGKGFQRLSTLPNGEAYILWKMLNLDAGNDPEERAIKMVLDEMNKMPIWQYLNNPSDTDTCSIGGNHMMNLYGKALDAEDVFNNAEAEKVSLGFKIDFME